MSSATEKASRFRRPLMELGVLGVAAMTGLWIADIAGLFDDEKGAGLETLRWENGLGAIETKKFKWAKVEMAVGEMFDLAEAEPPVWSDGTSTLTADGLRVCLSTNQVINVGDGFRDAVFLEAQYPTRSKWHVKEGEKITDSREINLPLAAMSELAKKLGWMQVELDMLVKTAIKVTPEVLAKSGVLGLGRLQADYTNGDVSGMPIVEINPPDELPGQSGVGHFVRITDRLTHEVGYYRLDE